MPFPALYLSLPCLIQVSDMQRLVSGYISFSAYCWSVIVFCLLKLFPLFLGGMPDAIILIYLCFNSIKIAALTNVFAMSLDLSRSRLFVL